jgi:thiamine-monophosphate kinase
LTTPASAPGTAVADVGERALIERIRRRLPAAPPSLVVGIGDDAAVVATDRGTLTVLTTDALVEGVHFDRRYSSAADVGYKALAVNVSDVAAMGAAPRLALLSLILPPNLPIADVDELIDGFAELGRATGVALAGGNITRSPGPLIVDVTVTGAVKPRRVLTRGGGRPGDQLFVSGSIGAAAAGLSCLHDRSRGRVSESDPALLDCMARHRRPEPRARLGSLLGRTRAASACMDLSDGLADAVRQIAGASGTGARIDAARLPIHTGARSWFSTQGQDPVTMSLAGGDDYELLFAVAARARRRLKVVASQARGVPFTHIGELTATPEIVLDRGGSVEPLRDGFVHF